MFILNARFGRRFGILERDGRICIKVAQSVLAAELMLYVKDHITQGLDLNLSRWAFSYGIEVELVMPAQ